MHTGHFFFFLLEPFLHFCKHTLNVLNILLIYINRITFVAKTFLTFSSESRSFKEIYLKIRQRSLKIRQRSLKIRQRSLKIRQRSLKIRRRRSNLCDITDTTLWPRSSFSFDSTHEVSENKNYLWPNLKNLSGVLNLSRGLNMVVST